MTRESPYIQTLAGSFVMTGLLDYIFENIDIEKLSRKEVLDYTAYISEIAKQSLPLDKKIKFLSVKVRLQQKLLQLDTHKTNLNGKFTSDKKRR